MKSWIAHTLATLTILATGSFAAMAPAEAQDTLPSDAFTDPAGGTGIVMIKRDDSGGGCGMTVYIDDIAITQLSSSQSISRFVPSGHHVIDAKACDGQSVRRGIDVRADRLSTFRIHSDGGRYTIKSS